MDLLGVGDRKPKEFEAGSNFLTILVSIYERDTQKGKLILRSLAV
jgi:hypothetical protein